eukprot:TRINITY_DN2610_c0_g1_i1.p1 TRINITY_DN2610_c0_g1~~TRINITY_DN2610_c0_g1_i1.p1  ORF type:complete len:544 (+),score=142.95 TRINITY_DN2610_c0_g1_i1:25-1656(+)
MAAKAKAQLKVDRTAPTVIDEDIIRSSIADVAVDDKSRLGVDLREVTTLAFSYKNIARIENLVGFKALIKLQLDNNCISTIENIGHLTTLEWLDLSFNNIQKIEGLETLTRLTDLSLYSNQISVLENLDALANLKVLSLGKNNVKNLDKLMYLRRFKKLRLLNLAGNGVCDDPEYRSYVLAFLKHLRYLDYKLVDENEVQAAREQHQDQLLLLEEQDRLVDARAAEAAKQGSYASRLTVANIGGIEDLYDLAVNEDPEMVKLRPLQNILTPLTEAQQRYKEFTVDFVTTMLQRHKQMEDEKAQYWAAMNELVKKNEDNAKASIAGFEARKKLVYRQLHDAEPNESNEAIVKQLVDSLEGVSDYLLELEITQVEQTEELTREFVNVTKELVTLNNELIQRFFGANVRPMELDTKGAIATLVEQEIERFNACVAADDVSDFTTEQQRLLEDKETLDLLLTQTHEFRNTRIDQMEDTVNQRVSQGLDEYINKLREEERDRNRQRVSEIWSYVDRQKTDIRKQFDDYFPESDQDESEPEEALDEHSP